MILTEELKILANTVMAIGVLATAAWADNAPIIQQQGNISYLTGGIGSDERRAMESVKNNYNLRVLSGNTARELQGFTRITIRNDQGQEVLSTDAGPLFYANLPQGNYRVEEAKNGVAKAHNVKIIGNRPSHISFIWNE